MLAHKAIDVDLTAWQLNAIDLAVERGPEAINLDRSAQRLKNSLDFFIRVRHRHGNFLDCAR